MNETRPGLLIKKWKKTEPVTFPETFTLRVFSIFCQTQKRHLLFPASLIILITSCLSRMNLTSGGGQYYKQIC